MWWLQEKRVSVRQMIFLLRSALFMWDTGHVHLFRVDRNESVLQGKMSLFRLHAHTEAITCDGVPASFEGVTQSRAFGKQRLLETTQIQMKSLFS